MTAIPKRLVVLLAEDDENDAFLIRRALERLVAVQRLVLVPDAERTIDYLRGDSPYADRVAWPLPDLLILDHWMPRLSGFEALCWLRTEPRLARLPVVVLSGGLSPAQTEAITNLAAACCSKAMDLAETVKEIEQAITEAFRMARQARCGSRDAQLEAARRDMSDRTPLPRSSEA